jgi:hypothetical protein
MRGVSVMSTQQIVIDCDAHTSEPPVLWTSRLTRKFQDAARINHL